VPPNELEEILRNLPQRGTLLKDRGYRQVWRFELGGRGYFLKFYPRIGSRLKRMIRGSPALREFDRLKLLQKAGIPSPRASSVLVGYRLEGRIGDAVIIEAIEPAVQLDQYYSEFKLRGEPVTGHRDLAKQIIEIVGGLGKAKLGHADLHLGNFLLHEGKLFLLDGYSVRSGGLKLSDVMLLGHSVWRFATRTDMRRGWLALGGDRAMPTANSASPRQWRKLVERSTGENDWFGKIFAGEWRGHYFKRSKFARRWAGCSGLAISAAEWEREWPALWDRINSGKCETLKTSRSGDVWAGEVSFKDAIVTAGTSEVPPPQPFPGVPGEGERGVAIPVIIKRPYKRYWYRYFNEIGRGSRSRRAWIKAWKIIARNIPTAWPLLILEKRTLGYVTDSVIIFEKVEGELLSAADLNAMDEAARDMLFRRLGRILRQIDSQGLAHFDAKASNWIVVHDEKLGPRPALIDVDGIRARKWAALGIQRLLRSMREHPQYTPRDSLNLCLGYSPGSAVSSPISQELS